MASSLNFDGEEWSMSLDVSVKRNQLDIVLGNLLQVTLLEQVG